MALLSPRLLSSWDYRIIKSNRVLLRPYCQVSELLIIPTWIRANHGACQAITSAKVVSSQVSESISWMGGWKCEPGCGSLFKWLISGRIRKKLSALSCLKPVANIVSLCLREQSYRDRLWFKFYHPVGPDTASELLGQDRWLTCRSSHCHIIATDFETELFLSGNNFSQG